MDCAQDVAYMGVKKIYDIEILSSMRAVSNIWTEMSTSVISNSWDHTGLTTATVDIDFIPTSAD